jgi:hypothetical protein
MQTFMEEMTRKQPDVDKVTKTHKRKAVVGSEPASQSHIPVLEKGRGGSMYPYQDPLKGPEVSHLAQL